MKVYTKAFVTVLFMVLSFSRGAWIAPVFAQSDHSSASQKSVLNERNKLMSLDFVDADLKFVLRLLAKQNNLNIIATDDIEGSVTVSFDHVTLKGALEAILAANGYDYVMHENIIIVKRRDTEMPGDVETKIYDLKFISADDAKSALQNVITDGRGHVEVFKRTYPNTKSGGNSDAQTGANVIVVTDIPSNFPHIEKVLHDLDKPVPQIMIAVKFIETRLEHNDAMGINWTVKARLSGGPSTASRLANAAGSSSNLGTGTSLGGSQSQNLGFPMFGQVSNLDVATLSLQEFQAVLEMLFTNGNSKLLSDPRITTLDNQPANIEVGTTIPVLVPQTQGSGNALVAIPQETFQDINVSISLNCVPHVNVERYITMVVEPLVEAITGYTGPDQDRPIVASRSAKTQVMVQDGETIAIGGLIKEDKFETMKKIPILGDIPLIGYLFKHKSNQLEKTDLLIFITPHIVGPKIDPKQLSMEK